MTVLALDKFQIFAVLQLMVNKNSPESINQACVYLKITTGRFCNYLVLECGFSRLVLITSVAFCENLVFVEF